MNKSLLTNLVAAVVTVVGFFLPPRGSHVVVTMGLFALSGAITNWLAVYMLFEKVPLLYGSGVIPSRFEDFKRGIHGLIMGQFFTKENVARLLDAAPGAKEGHLDVGLIKAAIDYDVVFDRIVQSVLGSKLGQTLSMFGGAQALGGLKEPIQSTLEDVVSDVITSEKFQHALAQAFTGPAIFEDIVEKVDRIVAARLDELTPQDVKRIVQDMIRQHLGWLVVWGGVFGGLIGLLTGLLT